MTIDEKLDLFEEKLVRSVVIYLLTTGKYYKDECKVTNKTIVKDLIDGYFKYKETKLKEIETQERVQNDPGI